MPVQVEPLVALGRALLAEAYHFVTVTPETHHRALLHRRRPARTARDVFGWGLPFARDALPVALFDALERSGALVERDHLYRSTVRFSSLGAHLFCHSAYPTSDADAVFFGPDTYRFCAAITRASRSANRVVDLGCGTGAGGITAAASATKVVLSDVNEHALTFARVNCALAGLPDVELTHGDLLAGVSGTVDYVIANPPYLPDEKGRLYRDGGGSLGEALSLRIVEEAMQRLEPGGTLLLYTGAPIVEGEDIFLCGARPLLERVGASFAYEEIDPDVFGEELDRPAYASVDRIAAVVLTATRP